MSSNYSTAKPLLVCLGLCLLSTSVSCTPQSYLQYENILFRSRDLFRNQIPYRAGAQQRPAAAAAPDEPEKPPAKSQSAAPDARTVTAPRWQGSTESTLAVAPYNYREHFSSTLFQPISAGNTDRNVVYSPSSVHSMLAMIYGVSSGETANELRVAGKFQEDKRGVAMDFLRVMQMERGLKDSQLILANKLYYNQALSALNQDYERYAREIYGSDVEAVDMTRSVNTANRINAWASDATGNIIRELVTPSDIDPETEALLVNAIYFKARWLNAFSTLDTTTAKFRVNANKVISVPMMFNDDVYLYAELPELDAKAIELAYMGNQVSMLLILPNQMDGLAQLERQLGSQDLSSIAARLKRDQVEVRVPKFSIEFEVDMTSPLQQLGVQRMFRADSQVDALLMRPVRVSKILQKAFINVNEAGSEAAAASFAKFVPLSLPLKARQFTADHPFLFAIRTPQSVLFIGHVVQPPEVNARH